MCIRDSTYSVSAVQETYRSEYAIVKAGAASLAPIVLTLSPVSYTHLRAHETVLDLVCRLLLEKKNQT